MVDAHVVYEDRCAIGMTTGIGVCLKVQESLS